jgi:hypothetical protein
MIVKCGLETTEDQIKYKIGWVLVCDNCPHGFALNEPYLLKDLNGKPLVLHLDCVLEFSLNLLGEIPSKAVK